MAKRVFNFYAGPATLPHEVVKKSAEALLDFNNLGLSIMEISHRAKDFEAVIKEAQKDVKQLMGLSDDYSVLFLQGGASLQFHMVPLNLKLEGKPCDYVDTGEWSTKALKESKLLGPTRIVATSQDKNFNYIPKPIPVNADASYLHITTNNTIEGTQFHANVPDTGAIPLIADMSSDIFALRRDWKKFALIYAGAQKNIGPAGTTLVVIRNDLLSRAPEGKLPVILRYKLHVEKESLYNTPSVFSIYVVHLVMKWIIEQGGLEAVEKNNFKKANLLYNAIDEMSDYFKGTVDDKASRSIMNVTFKLPNEELDNQFVSEAKKRDMVGLKGYRTVGGIRASIYNALPYEGVERLVDLMREFRNKK